MSLQSRLKGEFPPGGTTRSVKGALMSLQSRLKGEFPPGGTTRSVGGARS
ncbi:hypothetical protein THIARS_50087 [Thiomonas delicata]|uniref:Uncharacterized protein n=1 Tax=Thiomonas delicata TaxID=364030 RepID=A0A238D0U4_THIDL|nr:hypothetical protein THIARS_50087 [Thiomonas delicata]